MSQAIGATVSGQEIGTMNWKTWLKGLAAVAVGGAVTGMTEAIAKAQVNKGTAVMAGVGALTTVVAYLLQSPLVQKAAGLQAAPETPAEPDAAAK
jgi:hypothetical protein